MAIMNNLRRLFSKNTPGSRIFDIEISRNCNLTCAFCPREVLEKQGQMVPATFENFLKNSGLSPNDIVLFCGLGESLLSKSFPGYLARLRELHPTLPIQLVTNGTLLKPPQVSFLLDAHINCIMVSFNGTDAQTYESLMKGAHFTETLANLEYTLQEIRARNSKTHLRVTFIITKENCREEEKIKAFWEARGISVLPQYMHNRGGNVKMDTMTPLETTVPPGRPCTYFETFNFIAWNGDVLFCCHDIQRRNLLGNINSDTMKRIQARKRQYLRHHKWPDICLTCTAPPAEDM